MRARENSGERRRTRKEIDFKIYLEQELFEKSELKQHIEQIEQKNQVKISVDESVQLPEAPGVVLVINSPSLEDKRIATGEILDKVKEFVLRNNRMVATILVPEAIVSLLIGAKGRTIGRLKEQTGAEIIVNQPVSGMNVRGVRIEGKIGAILRGCQAVMNHVEEQAASIDDLDKSAFSINKKET